jgi:hypothetical protein
MKSETIEQGDLSRVGQNGRMDNVKPNKKKVSQKANTQDGKRFRFEECCRCCYMRQYLHEYPLPTMRKSMCVNVENTHSTIIGLGISDSSLDGGKEVVGDWTWSWADAKESADIILGEKLVQIHKQHRPVLEHHLLALVLVIVKRLAFIEK